MGQRGASVADLVSVLARGIAVEVHDALARHSHPDARVETSTAAQVVADQVRYVVHLHRGLGRAAPSQLRERLVDVFAWGLALFVQDRSLGDGVKSESGSTTCSTPSRTPKA